MAIAMYADDSEFRAIQYGMPRSEDRRAIRQRLEDTARQFGILDSDLYQRARERFDSFDFDRIERKVDALKRKVTHLFDKDEIRPMWRIGQFQQAGFEQARWLMANPRTQRLYEKDMIHGWRDFLTHDYNGRIGDDNPDYQEVVNGLVQYTEEGNAFFVEYPLLYDEDMRTQLTFGQQTTIRDSMWANFETFLDEGLDDPSSPENSSL